MTEYKVRFWIPGFGLYDKIPGRKMEAETYATETEACKRAVYLSINYGELVGVYRVEGDWIKELKVFMDHDVMKHLVF